MQLSIQQIKPNDHIAIYSPSTEVEYNAFEIMIDSIKRVDEDLYEIVGYDTTFIFDENTDIVYSTIEEAIDRIRYVDRISNFDNTTFSYYLPILTRSILDGVKVHVVVRDRVHHTKIIRTCKIKQLKYNGKWKIKLEGIDTYKYYLAWHNADKLGNTIFFSKENALNKVGKAHK